MNNSTIIREYESYFNVTKLQSLNSTILFYPIFKRFIITHFIILLKTYLQLLNGKNFLLSANGIKYFNLYDDPIINSYLEDKNIIYNYLLTDNIINNAKYKLFIEKLKDEITSELGVNILKIIGNSIIDNFSYTGNNDIDKITYISLLKILYFLLDYKVYINFELFQTEITKYIDLLYDSDETNENVEPLNTKNIEKYLFLIDLSNTYTESLRLYCNDNNYIETTKCNTYYVEFNDINKINDITHQLLSIFVFVSDRKSESENKSYNIIISKHFFIVKDIINHILYELNIKTQKIIGYSSIILHSYCAYKFNESFFITNPKLNMKSIFIKYMKHGTNTIQILDNFNLLIKSSDTNININNGKNQLFIDNLLDIGFNIKTIYDNIQYLILCCKFSNQAVYNGNMLFNVINFHNDWINLLKTYLIQSQNTIGGRLSKNISKNNKSLKHKTKYKTKHKIKHKKNNKTIKKTIGKNIGNTIIKSIIKTIVNTS